MKSSTCDAGLRDLALCQGDCALVLAQRLCEWIGNAHSIEEELALGNVGLDLLGQARAWLSLAGEADGRSEDELAYLRDEDQWRNFVLCEQPNGDYAHTVCRQLLFAAYQLPLLEGLQQCPERKVAGIAASARREVAYHYRHFAAWFARFGAGTDESRRRVTQAVDRLWPLCGELFAAGPQELDLASSGRVPHPEQLRAGWLKLLEPAFADAQLELPDTERFIALHSRAGVHSEHLGHLLAQMQSLARAHPQASW